jgi:hypothetical protein
MKKNDVSSFFYYMWNSWCEEECRIVFASEGWQHFWNKWSSAYNEGGVRGASERFFAELSLSNQDLLVKRAIELYDRKSRIKL